VLKRLFGPKSDEIVGNWKKFQNEKLLDLQSSPNIIRLTRPKTMKWRDKIATHDGR
jgi:hypothetical protein